MTYDRNSFLAGVAAGRQLKGWGAGGGGGGAYRAMDLNYWPKAECAPPIAFDGRDNTLSFTAVRGSYERIYCPVMVKPFTDYCFSVEFDGTFQEGNRADARTYFAVTDSELTHNYIEDQAARVLGKTLLLSGVPGRYRVDFNSGARGFVYLYFDLAAVLDGTSVTLKYGDVSFSPRT